MIKLRPICHSVQLRFCMHYFVFVLLADKLVVLQLRNPKFEKSSFKNFAYTLSKSFQGKVSDRLFSLGNLWRHHQVRKRNEATKRYLGMTAWKEKVFAERKLKLITIHSMCNRTAMANQPRFSAISFNLIKVMKLICQVGFAFFRKIQILLLVFRRTLLVHKR